jgi:hypothetical protein
MTADTGAALAAISRASLVASGSTSPAGQTVLTRPPASASAAPNTLPDRHHYSAWLIPTTRGRNQD